MQEPPPLPESASPQAAPPSTSLAARLLNVFAVPGDVFEEVKATPFRAGNWVVPVVLAAVVGVLWALIAFSQPSIQQKLREQQEKMFSTQVQAGKLSQADADRMLDAFANPMLLKVITGAGAVVVSLVRVFWWGLALWLLGRWFLRAQFDFLKALEVSGLSLMIGVLGTLVYVLLVVNLGQLFASPSLALTIRDFDSTRKSHLFAGAANVFSFWQVAVSAVGLGKLAGVPFLRAMLLVLTFWLLEVSLLIVIGMGNFAL